MTSKTPFLYSFIAGVLSVVVIGALTFLFIFSWRYYRSRHKLESSNKEIRLTTLEDGRTTSDKLGPSFRSPSRLGDNSPSSAESADEAWESQSQFSAQIGTANGAQDGQRPFSVVSQSSAYIVRPMTIEGVEQVEDQPIRANDSSDPTILGKDDNMSTEHDRLRPLISRSPPGIPIRPLPPAPPKSNGRSSISTVWSQESMWPREKKLDVSVPEVPPLAHLPVTRRVMFSPLMAAGFQNRRSTSSLPRSVGQSDFDEDF